MSIGWENDIQICEELEKILNELLVIYEEVNKKVPEDEMNFVKITIIAIEKCL